MTDNFLNQLKKIRKNNYKKIRGVCQAHITEYQKNFAVTTVKGYITKDRRRIMQELGQDHPSLWLPLHDNCQNCGFSLIPHKQRENGKCPECDQAIQKAFTLPLETMRQLTADRAELVENRSKAKNKIKISASRFINVCENLVIECQDGKSYVKTAFTLAACTGRRINSEILTSGAFFTPRKNEITFSGQAKNRAETKPYRIKTIIPAKTVYELWTALCDRKTFISDSDRDIQTVCSPPRTMNSGAHFKLFRSVDDRLIDLRKKIAFRCSKELTALARKHFGWVPGIKTHDLRGLNALVTAYLDSQDSSDMLKYAKKHLGHKNLEQAVDYEKFSIIK